jgi:hypothetical protein
LLHPEVRGRLLEQSAVDQVSGQVDPHDNNIIVAFDENNGLAASQNIDPDASMTLLTDPDEAAYNADDPSCSFRGIRMPQYVFEDLYNKIMAKNPDALRNTVAGELLPAPQVDALVARLERLQDHYQELAANGHVLPFDEWADVMALHVKPDWDHRHAWDYSARAVYGQERKQKNNF